MAHAPASTPASSSSSPSVTFRSKERDLSGTQLGEFRLTRKIAVGGMGEVYEAVQLKLDRRVAVKVLSEELEREDEFLARFEREAKSAAALNHPNVVQVYDYGTAGGHFYFVMELVDGVDLSAHVKEHGKLPIPIALGFFEQAVNALKFAARHAIIHRDAPVELELHGLVNFAHAADGDLAREPKLAELRAGEVALLRAKSHRWRTARAGWRGRWRVRHRLVVRPERPACRRVFRR